MTIDMQALPPKLLGFWARTLRVASNLSQEALAAASGLTVRTIQRVESGERASLTTRRCLARGLGYDNPNVFDDPAFVATVTEFMESLRAGQIEAEEARHPDHIKLEVAPVMTGAVLGGQIDRCDAWVFHCDEQATPEGQAEAASLSDNLQDYGDIWPELPPSARLDAQNSFSAMLDVLAEHELRAYQAIRAAHLAPAAKDQAPLPFTIGYVTVVPAGQTLTHILVPKRA